MTNLGDLVRGCAGWADELFVEWVGKPLLYYDLLVDSTLPPWNTENYQGADYIESHKSWSETPVALRAFYEPPVMNSCSPFGIDDLDEMKVELAYRPTIQRLGKVPSIGGLVADYAHNKWIIIQRHLVDSTVRGQSRLVLVVQRFQESVSSKKAG